MPQHGFGTYMIPKESLSTTLVSAYDLGYRQFESISLTLFISFRMELSSTLA